MFRRKTAGRSWATRPRPGLAFDHDGRRDTAMIISEEKTPRGAVEEDDRKIHLLEILGNAIIGGMESTVIALIAHLPASFAVTCVCPYESAFTARLRELGCTVYITAIRDDPP